MWPSSVMVELHTPRLILWSVAQMRELLRTSITVNYPDPSGPDGWPPQEMRSLRW
jgi:hypothetical protein